MIAPVTLQRLPLVNSAHATFGWSTGLVQPALPWPVPFRLVLVPGVVAGLLVSPTQATANSMRATVSVVVERGGRFMILNVLDESKVD